MWYWVCRLLHPRGALSPGLTYRIELIFVFVLFLNFFLPSFALLCFTTACWKHLWEWTLSPSLSLPLSLPLGLWEKELNRTELNWPEAVQDRQRFGRVSLLSVDPFFLLFVGFSWGKLGFLLWQIGLDGILLFFLRIWNMLDCFKLNKHCSHTVWIGKTWLTRQEKHV